MIGRSTATLLLTGATLAGCLIGGCNTLGSGTSINSSGGTTASGMVSSKAAILAPPGGAGTAVGVDFVRAIAAKVSPSVVTVHTLAAVDRQPMTLQDMLGQQDGQGGGTVRRGAGSGVIISADGYVLTNNHVVEGAQSVTVEVGGTGYDARVVGTDPLSDIAVVKITPPAGITLPVAELGDSDAVHVGDWAIAIGNPLDIGATVTLGIVSAIGARGPHLQGDAASTVLQTDAAINPGNSGGALVDSNGKVIGINEAILSPTGASIGIGFAIPIDAAHKIADQLIANGRVMRPYLGISYVAVKSVPPQAREQAGINPSLNTGVVVAQVGQNTPAADAGLQPGDVIVKADNQTLDGQDALSKIIGSHKVGDTLPLEMQRAGQSHDISVTLRERPAASAPQTGGQ
jgi:S1-C subfamily serine protease